MMSRSPYYKQPPNEMVTGTKIRYRQDASGDLREGQIITSQDDLAWVADQRLKTAFWIHKSQIIFDNIPKTGITMPRMEDIKHVGPVQMGHLHSHHLETQLHQYAEAQNSAIVKQQSKKTAMRSEKTTKPRTPKETTYKTQSPRQYRLTQIGTNSSSSGYYSTAARPTYASRVARGNRSNSSGSTPRSKTRTGGDSSRRANPMNGSPTPPTPSPPARGGGRSRSGRRGNRPPFQQRSPDYGPMSGYYYEYPRGGGFYPYYESNFESGYYFYDRAGHLFYQEQRSGVTFLVDGDIFYPVNSGPHSTLQYSSPEGVDPRLVPEMFEGWRDSRGVWYPRTATVPPDAFPGMHKRRGTSYEDKARENPFLWKNKSMEERVQAQLEHYFSPGNLEQDSFMKSLMDDRGYVEAKQICSFRRMQHHHVSMGLVLQAGKQSKRLKVKNTKIRAKNAWWLYLSHHISEDDRVDSSDDAYEEDEKEQDIPNENAEEVKNGSPASSDEDGGGGDERKVEQRPETNTTATEADALGFQ